MIRWLGFAVAVMALATACSPGSDTTVVVAAASSIEPAMRDIAAAYEAEHPGIDVASTTGGSSLLRDQVVLARAPIDLVVLADDGLLQPIVEAGLTSGSAQRIATNELVLVVPSGNPGRVTSLGDLADPSLVVGLCAVGVPCGDLAATALAEAGVTASVDTYEPNVRALAAKLEAGELDAGLVYASDVVASGGALVAVPVADPLPRTTYGAAVTVTGSSASAASDFLGFLESEAGLSILSEYGFGPP